MKGRLLLLLFFLPLSVWGYSEDSSLLWKLTGNTVPGVRELFTYPFSVTTSGLLFSYNENFFLGYSLKKKTAIQVWAYGESKYDDEQKISYTYFPYRNGFLYNSNTESKLLESSYWGIGAKLEFFSGKIVPMIQFALNGKGQRYEPEVDCQIPWVLQFPSLFTSSSYESSNQNVISGVEPINRGEANYLIGSIRLGAKFTDWWMGIIGGWEQSKIEMATGHSYFAPSAKQLSENIYERDFSRFYYGLGFLGVKKTYTMGLFANYFPSFRGTVWKGNNYQYELNYPSGAYTRYNLLYREDMRGNFDNMFDFHLFVLADAYNSSLFRLSSGIGLSFTQSKTNYEITGSFSPGSSIAHYNGTQSTEKEENYFKKFVGFEKKNFNESYNYGVLSVPFVFTLVKTGWQLKAGYSISIEYLEEKRALSLLSISPLTITTENSAGGVTYTLVDSYNPQNAYSYSKKEFAFSGVPFLSLAFKGDGYFLNLLLTNQIPYFSLNVGVRL